MPAFCHEYGWCTPAEFRRLTVRDYLALREDLDRRAEAMKGDR